MNGPHNSDIGDDTYFDSAARNALRVSDHVTSMPVIDYELVQLGRGEAQLRYMQFFGRNLVFSEQRVDPKYTGYIVPHPDWCAFFAPIEWRGDFIYNGIEARQNDLFLSVERQGYVTIGQRRHTVSLGVRKAQLQQASEALAGAPLDDLLASNRKLTLNSPAGRSLLRGVTQAIYMSVATPLRTGGYALDANAEASLIDTLALLLLEQSRDGAVRDAGSPSARSTVWKAKSRIDQLGSAPVTLSEMAAAAGVSRVWLHKCFLAVHGVSPLTYLRAYRLNQARERLLDPVDPPPSIKDVSIGLGFMNGGRFAKRYEAIFGEKPTETFKRNPALRQT